MGMPAHEFGDKYVHKCWSRRCLCLLSIHLGSTLAYFDRWPFASGFDPSFRDSDVKLKTEGGNALAVFLSVRKGKKC